MLIRSSADLAVEGNRAEVVLRNPGATSICLIGRDGSVASIVRLRVEGPERVAARTHLPLRLGVDAAAEDLIPVVVYQSNRAQTIHIMGQDHSEATKARSQSLGVARDFTEAQKIEWHAREKAYWISEPISDMAK